MSMLNYNVWEQIKKHQAMIAIPYDARSEFNDSVTSMVGTYIVALPVRLDLIWLLYSEHVVANAP